MCMPHLLDRCPRVFEGRGITDLSGADLCFFTLYRTGSNSGISR